jgi:CRP/FNR family transcriptional regulator
MANFFAKYTKLQYKKGELILRAGDPPPGALYLAKGLVRMSFAAQTGEMLVLHVFKPGSCFPMPWIINDTPNRYYFESLTPVEIWRAPREDVHAFFETHADVAAYMMSKVLFGLSGLLQRMEFLVFDSAYKKTILLLLYYAKNFMEDGAKGKLAIPLTHKEIAAWIGTTRETASLQIETLKKKKIIQYNRRYIVIPNIAVLEKESKE